MAQIERLDGVHAEKVRAGTHVVFSPSKGVYHTDPDCPHVGDGADTVAKVDVTRRDSSRRCEECRLRDSIGPASSVPTLGGDD